MKKLFLSLTLFISATSFAQTKEETIDWINTYALKMIGRPDNGVNNFSATEDGLITIQNGQIGSNGEQIISQNTSLYLKDIILPTKTEYRKDGDLFEFDIKTIGNKIKIYNGSYISEMIIWSKDKDNLERLAKAIFHLAKLCGAKEKPKENTF